MRYLEGLKEKWRRSVESFVFSCSLHAAYLKKLVYANDHRYMTASEIYNVCVQQDTVMSACFCLMISETIRLLSTRSFSFYCAAII